MSRGPLRFTTPEERAKEREEWIKKHYLVDGRRYTFQTSKHWHGEYSFGKKKMRWTSNIREVDPPYNMFGFSPSFNHEMEAINWAKEYLKRGGPPDGYFDPPPPDPNIVTFRKAA